jgi:DMSO/TMAO reductase YedYZ molybdopterin-dependent catalytic subunit
MTSIFLFLNVNLKAMFWQSLLIWREVSNKTYRLTNTPFSPESETMNKKIAIATTATIIVVVALSAILLAFYNPQSASFTLPSGEPPQGQIQVTGNVAQEKAWSINELAQMPLTTVKTMIDGENVTCKGVALIDFCNKTGMLWDSGPIEITGADGEKATLSTFQAWNSTFYPYYQDQNRITLVFIENDHWMTEENGGPVRLVSPYFSADYQVEHVTGVRLGIWTISVSGAVSNSLTISSQNLATFQEETVQAEFVPGDGTRRTSNWTGLPVLDVLRAAGMSDRAEKVTVRAIDGYEKNYTLQEIEDGHMMIGYGENGGHFWQDQGGPYRLFCTTDKYKWGQFWVKFISQVIVT